jgi:hypothetical protein
MRHLNNALFILCSIIIFSAVLKAETKVTPVASVDLTGGQYWVTGAAPDKFSGNADVFFSPVINFSQNTALIPIYSGFYSSTKDVKELVGGGTLTRELQDHSLALKYVAKLGDNWKLKSRIGYKIEYLKETVDETWGKGIFDYTKMILGFEAEKGWEKWTGRAGVDFYTMRYPNYQSLVLESGFQTSVDTTTYTEISSQAGKDILDYDTLSLFIEGKRNFSEYVSGTIHNDISVKNFKGQKIVNNTGMFSETLRSDIVDYLTLKLRAEAGGAAFELTDGIQYNRSNQNSFDASGNPPTFISDFYNYLQNSFMPSITFYLGKNGKPARLTLLWDITYRQYLERPAQSVAGNYMTDKVYQTTNTLGLTYIHPLSKNLSAKYSANYRDVTSNMKYEKNYLYNYYTFNYFIGINWSL